MKPLSEKEKNILVNIETIGKNCVENFNTTVLFINNISLNSYKETIMTDWWEALKFFLQHSFMRGRRDELSEKYFKFTIKVLESIKNNHPTDFFELWTFDFKSVIVDFKKMKKITKGNCLSIEYKAEFHNYIVEKHYDILQHFILPFYNEEQGESEKVFINNDRDLLMILDVLNFISSKTNANHNIVEYSMAKIYNGKVTELCYEFKKIIYIGDKIATFFLRNLAFVFSLTTEILNNNKTDIKCFLPIDTWIAQVCVKTGIIDESQKNNLEIVKENLIEKCNGIINPLFFNQGAWYLGANSFDMMFELLKKENILRK